MDIIDRKTVKHVAHLARLSLNEKELSAYCSQLASILSYINKLKEIDTKDTPPTTHPLSGLKNVFRKDILKTSLPIEDALSNAPQKEENFFKVPQVIEGK